MNALIFGATGLCGRYFVEYAEKSSKISKIFTVTRRSLPQKVGPRITQLVETDNSKWASMIPDKEINVLFTSLSTTRGAAGGFDEQYKIDHDLNIELAKAAKEKGCSTIVLVSSRGAHADSRMAYTRMKGEIERDIIALGFDHTIILRPGILLGQRDSNGDSGFGGGIASMIGGFLYNHKRNLFKGHSVEAEDVGKVGVHLALDEQEKVRIVESKEIIEIAEKISK
ncbi:Fmp52p NDAI_0E03640 [Naumovozyma dairenensis CBS 421]|uniref:Protein FMP52, mitochondrial n=1 Tax=Naumovozyma dairenensis (strain ATCC 10597 / BCRC 20456 / CBS 421 / NBRC 0211 / NRRL Y-12639) TaxID=1071378 RepID=G0WBR1_NAUDC|nr:hypothetical protein NDAI_0E03640 [Naumovozyma dairenensis CBS 421]CCD25181.1 hypothetical protein NDAI_0E03640 [Naumovozyma dairenensis CBS 421]